MVTICVGKKEFEHGGDRHAEQVMFAEKKYQSGNLSCSMDAWPCLNEGKHDCHKLFLTQSFGRTIVLEITDDKGGYARNHRFAFGATGQITYANGVATYVPPQPP